MVLKLESKRLNRRQVGARKKERTVFLEPGAELILRGHGNQLNQDQPLTAYNWSNKLLALPAPRCFSMQANEGVTNYNPSIHVGCHPDTYDTLH